jgi:hypothetical protein
MMNFLSPKVGTLRGEGQAEGFPAAEVPGFSHGVVVNVRICK